MPSRSPASRRPRCRAPAPREEPRDAARFAGLRYVSDQGPGIRRRRAGRGFTYRRPDGQPLRDKATLAWIRSLAIPPAWDEVWISPIRQGHLLATGRDARGRKQYRYHPRWRATRDETKYTRTIAFAKALPKIRQRSRRDLRRPGLPREKILATVVQLLEKTLIRIGNEEYARSNRSYGLTTMRNRHVEVDGWTLRFEFRGKGGKPTSVDVADRRLAGIVKRCQELPGQELFQYIDEEGKRQTIDSGDVNEYLREITGEDYTAKDFRTWAGTVRAHQELLGLEQVDSEVAARRNVVQAIEAVAEHLGNTPAVSRKSYVHPAVIEDYIEGSLADAVEKAGAKRGRSLSSLGPEEAEVLALLQRRLAQVNAPAARTA